MGGPLLTDRKENGGFIDWFGFLEICRGGAMSGLLGAQSCWRQFYGPMASVVQWVYLMARRFGAAVVPDSFLWVDCGDANVEKVMVGVVDVVDGMGLGWVVQRLQRQPRL